MLQIIVRYQKNFSWQQIELAWQPLPGFPDHGTVVPLQDI